MSTLCDIILIILASKVRSKQTSFEGRLGEKRVLQVDDVWQGAVFNAV